MIHPTGWKYKKYAFVDGRLLYNRCHLIGWQLTGSTADPKNLVTGTRFMNVKGMLPWENKLADYLKHSNNHVMYKVVPIYSGKELVCRGVHMQAMSVEDKGKSLSFNVYCYNVQPGVEYTLSLSSDARGLMMLPSPLFCMYTTGTLPVARW